MIRDRLSAALLAAARDLAASDPSLAALAEARPEIADTKDPSHGDFATNLAMVSAKKVGLNPRALAERLAPLAVAHGAPLVAAAEVAGPGFLNLRLDPVETARSLEPLVTSGTFPKAMPERPLRVNVEFVSVNPNGPITIGSGRGAAFGSALCNVLEAAGHTVHREYYINDGVNSEQMRLFAESVRSYVEGTPFPEGGYKGEYVQDVAKALQSAVPTRNHNGYTSNYASPPYKMELLPWDTDERNQLRSEWLDRRLGAWKDERREAFIKWFSSSNVTIPQVIAAMDFDSQETTGIYQALSQSSMLKRQEIDLDNFGVRFDTWFSEQSLHDNGEVERRILELTAKGVADAEPYRTKLKLGKGGKVEEVIREEQSAEDADVADDGGPLTTMDAQSSATVGDREPSSATLWLRSTRFGDDMDRVLRRRDGRLTYIASDVAYHADKFNRPPKADRLITILGPDHHGYIGRLRAVVAALIQRKGELEEEALERAKERLEVVIYQLVRFLKDGKPAPMRKRDGNIYELRDLISEIGKEAAPLASPEEQLRVGRDVGRFFFLMRSHDSALDFDIDLAVKGSDENPVFYVQYAHARIRSIIEKAAEAGLTPDTDALSTLHDSREAALARKIADLPWEIGRAAEDYGVHRIATYASELARTFTGFYEHCRVVQPDDVPRSRGRLALCSATAIALREALGVLGISAPDRM